MTRVNRLILLVALAALVAMTFTACGPLGPITVISITGGCDTSEFSIAYYVEGTLSSTSSTQPDRLYIVFLEEHHLIGKKLELNPQVISWSQSEMDLMTTKAVRWYIPDDKAALYNLDFYKDHPLGSFSTEEEQAYSDEIQKTIRDHFTLSWIPLPESASMVHSSWTSTFSLQ